MTHIHMKRKENKIIISVNQKLYPLEAAYGAAYAFLDKAYIYLEEGPKSKIQITLKGKEKLTKKGLEALKGEFLNELLNSSLRDRISKNNKKIREYMIGRALASALSGPERPIEKKEQIFEKELSAKNDVWDKEALKEEFEKTLFSQKKPEEVIIPWKKKNQKEEKSLTSNKVTFPFQKNKPIWIMDPEGIAIPWEEKYLKQKNKKKKTKKC